METNQPEIGPDLVVSTSSPKVFCPYCGSSLAEQKDTKQCSVCMKELESTGAHPAAFNPSVRPRPSFIAPFNPNQ